MLFIKQDIKSIRISYLKFPFECDAITSAFASQLNFITLDEGARSEIQQALAQGLEVTVHQSPINVNGWQGSGYSVLDPETGVGAYLISGGASGGILSSIIGIMSAFLSVFFGALELLATHLKDLLRASFFAAAGRVVSTLDLYEYFFASVEGGCRPIQIATIFLIGFLSVILQIAAAVFLPLAGAFLVPLLVSKMASMPSKSSLILVALKRGS